MARLSDSITYGNHSITGDVNVGGTLTVDGSTVWHSGNDGSGSGLDADTLDGQHAAAFAAASHSHDYWRDGGTTFSGTYPLTMAIDRSRLFSHTNITYTGSSNTLTAPNFSGNGSGLTNVDAADSNKLNGLTAGNYLRSTASDTMDAGTNTTLTIKSNDTGKSTLNLYGDSQGTGQVYVGQSTTHGGGIEYNGDGSPVTTGAGSDYITLFRRAGGPDEWTARNKYNSNTWEFRGSITAAGNITAYSDIRVKTNIEVIPEALDEISQISGYTFNRIDDVSVPRQIGVIAQEVLEVLPEAVIGGPTDDDPDGHYSVAYGNMVGLLIEGLKEESSKRETIELTLAEETSKREALESRLEKLEKLLGDES